MGLLIYAFLAAGLGCWLKAPSRSGLAAFGLRLSAGYAAAIVLLYLFGVIARVPVVYAFWIVAGTAAAGVLFRLRACRWRIAWRAIGCHPAAVLIVAGVVAMVANGGISYLPMGHDEFSHWLANPLRIHSFGSWAAAREAIYLAGYPPGWPLMLALPWQPFDAVDFGASAAAPFVLHVAAIALIYDLVVFMLVRRGRLGRRHAELAAWGFVLLFLAAEGLGPLWPTTLLIEPPQMLGYSIFLLLLFASQLAPQDERLLDASAGVVLASCYLVKSAAILFVPAVIVICALRVLSSGAGAERRFRSAAISCALLTVPVLVTAATWSFFVVATDCINSPLKTFTPEALAAAGGLDWRDLGDRYFAAIWDYVSRYKTPLTIAAAIGVGGSLARGAYRAPVALAVMAACYFAALYWYHLTCFGSYYFEHLNSIPRFTRVLVRSLHGLGLVLLLDLALAGMARFFGPDGIGKRLAARWVPYGLLIPVAFLAAWQAQRVDRSVDIVSTRRGEAVDPRIDEMRRAAVVIERLKRRRLPAMPVLLVVSQGMNSAVRSYAEFFAISRRRGDAARRYRVLPEHSWSPEPANVWQTRAGPEDVRARLLQADIIWPTSLDPWLRDILATVVEDDSCLRALPGKALVRVREGTAEPRFACIEKRTARPPSPA